jgi:type 1 glutamine amidotransferase
MVLVAASVATVSCSSPESDEVTTTSQEQREPTETTVPQSTTTESSITTSSAAVSPPGVLVFHKTAGFRHDSIEAGMTALEELLAETDDYEVTATEDASVFSAEGLQHFDVIVFMNTTGDVLDESQQEAMEEFIRAGKGFVGVHSAADTEYEWPWYGGLVGAYFDSHPDPQPAMLELVDSHPVVEEVPEQFERFDEWYNFGAHPEPDVTILATLDESSYEGGNMGEAHPIVWAHEYDGGRSVYVGFGHTPETFAEPLIRTLLGNAVRWAAG